MTLPWRMLWSCCSVLRPYAWRGLGPLGQPLFLLIADARQLLSTPLRRAACWTGAASAENLLRLFGIAVTPTALQYVLTGDVPLATLPTTGEFVYRSAR